MEDLGQLKTPTKVDELKITQSELAATKKDLSTTKKDLATIKSDIEQLMNFGRESTAAIKTLIKKTEKLESAMFEAGIEAYTKQQPEEGIPEDLNVVTAHDGTRSINI